MNKTRANFSITEKVDRLLDTYASEYDMTRSEIVVNAVEEYLEADRMARIEKKLEEIDGKFDRILEEEVQPRGEEEKKEKSDEDFSDSRGTTEKRADEMYRSLQKVADNRSQISREQLVEAIEKEWGDASDYMVEKYVNRLELRLEADGWYNVETTQYWSRSEEDYSEQLRTLWGRQRDVLEADPREVTLDELNDAIEFASENQGALADYGIDDARRVAELLIEANKRRQALEKRS